MSSSTQGSHCENPLIRRGAVFSLRWSCCYAKVQPRLYPSTHIYALPTYSIQRRGSTSTPRPPASRSLDRTLDKVVGPQQRKEGNHVCGAEDVTRLARLLTDRIAHAAAAPSIEGGRASWTLQHTRHGMRRGKRDNDRSWVPTMFQILIRKLFPNVRKSKLIFPQ